MSGNPAAKLWNVLAIGVRGALVGQWPLIVRASSEDGARSEGRRIAEKLFPQKDGYWAQVMEVVEMTDYQRGFLEGLQAACFLASAERKRHMEDARKLPPPDGEDALVAGATIAFFLAELDRLGAQVRRGELDPRKIAEANSPPFWWATADGKGRG